MTHKEQLKELSKFTVGNNVSKFILTKVCLVMPVGTGGAFLLQNEMRKTQLRNCLGPETLSDEEVEQILDNTGTGSHRKSLCNLIPPIPHLRCVNSTRKMVPITGRASSFLEKKCVF